MRFVIPSSPGDLSTADALYAENKKEITEILVREWQRQVGKIAQQAVTS